MKLEKEDFNWAAQEGIISTEQAQLLWDAFSQLDREDIENRPRFNFANFAYYFGALIVISAMGWFMSLTWENFGGAGMFIIACLYALGFSLVGKNLYFTQNLKVPGGLLFAMAVCMTPLAVYGLQRWTGFWLQGDPGVYRDFHTWIKGSWFFMEIGTILTGLITLRFVKFPFLTAPIAFCLWYMSMDITPLIFGENEYTWKQRALVSFWFGIGCIIVAYLVDLRHRRSQGDFAFWLYLFGIITFWFSLPILGDGTEWGWFLYCVTNLLLMLLSLLLKRRVFMVFGGIGVFAYLSHLSYSVFADSMLFPLALTALGLGIIYIGVLYQRHYQTLESRVYSLIPQEFKHLIPKEF